MILFSNSAYLIEREQTIRRELEDVFAFFSDPGNLEAITPPWLRFRVTDCSTPEIREGTTIEYRLRLHGIPVRWRSRIREWNPPFGFIDEQIQGPYRSWVHRHTFRAFDDGVLVGDRVDYSVPGGPLVHGLFVRRDLRRIFDYRQERLASLLSP